MLKPDEKMLRFLDWERGVFMHFGIRTFNQDRRDWDYVDMPVDSFNPTDLDCRQWARIISEAGFSYAVMTAKHHDGFCLWQSESTDYSVKNCSWRDGKGDVVREYLDAMREYGIKTGLYYSPADQVIFSKKLSMAEHNQVIRKHLEELCTNYGPIDYLWFDNCGSDKCVYEWAAITREVINRHQPDTVMNSNGDVQSSWVGNESGYAPYPCKYTHDLASYGDDRVSQRVLQSAEDGRFWSPTEADAMMDANSWFYREHDRRIRSLDELMGMYYLSVGRGINLLLNVSPDTRGKLPDADRDQLLAVGRAVEETFSHPVGSLAEMSRDGDRFVLTLDQAATMNHVVLAEDIETGTSIEGLTIYGQPYKHSREPVMLHRGTKVGHKAICAFPTVYFKQLVVEITDSSGPWELTGIDVYGPGDKQDT